MSNKKKGAFGRLEGWRKAVILAAAAVFVGYTGLRLVNGWLSSPEDYRRAAWEATTSSSLAGLKARALDKGLSLLKEGSPSLDKAGRVLDSLTTGALTELRMAGGQVIDETVQVLSEARRQVTDQLGLPEASEWADSVTPAAVPDGTEPEEAEEARRKAEAERLAKAAKKIEAAVAKVETACAREAAELKLGPNSTEVYCGPETLAEAARLADEAVDWPWYLDLTGYAAPWPVILGAFFIQPRRRKKGSSASVEDYDPSAMV